MIECAGDGHLTLAGFHFKEVILM